MELVLLNASLEVYAQIAARVPTKSREGAF